MTRLDKIPQIIDWHRDALNGLYPSANYYRRIVDGLNHLTAHRHREVYAMSAHLGDGTYHYSGTTTIARFRFRSGYGATRVRVRMLLGRDIAAGTSTTPTAKVTIGGTDIGPFSYGQTATATDDEPDALAVFTGEATITPATVYACSVVTTDHARVMGLSVVELGDETIDAAVNYFSRLAPAAGTEIYAADFGRLSEGLSKIWRQNGGTCCHWNRQGGLSRTRSAATAVNVIDNSSTTPSASTPGWTLDLSYRGTQGRSTVPFELAVYGSVSSGTGTVNLVDSGGATVITVSVNSSTAQWFTGTGLLPSSSAKYDLHLVGDGTNTTTIYAVSLLEWEA